MGNEEIDEMTVMKVILRLKQSIDELKLEVKNLSERFDFFKEQIREKDSWQRKLIYITLTLLGTIAGAGGIVKAILGAIP